jgi:TRAF3-interacting protein 1
MRDDDPEEEEDNQPPLNALEEDDNDDRGMHQQNRGFGDDGRSGAMVEEAKRLMEDDDDEVQPAAQEQVEEDSGPKIKMGKIGKKGKKPAAAAANSSEGYTKKLTAANLDRPSAGSGGGFNENDIEFMKKAIQVLCQSTNPLGKSIDYVTDDVDSMSKEYEHWRKEAITCS